MKYNCPDVDFFQCEMCECGVRFVVVVFLFFCERLEKMEIC